MELWCLGVQRNVFWVLCFRRRSPSEKGSTQSSEEEREEGFVSHHAMEGSTCYSYFFLSTITSISRSASSVRRCSMTLV